MDGACSAAAARPRARRRVPFGHLMEGTRGRARRRAPAARGRRRRRSEWLAYRVVLPRHAVLLALTWLLAVAQRLHLVPRRFGLPALSLAVAAHARCAADADPDAWLFTGCVMDAWQRDVHRAALRVMRAAGARVRAARAAAATAAARCTSTPAATTTPARLARRVIASMPGDAPDRRRQRRDAARR